MNAKSAIKRMFRPFLHFRSKRSIEAERSAIPASNSARRNGKSDQELEASASRLERFATICGWFVAGGVVLEYVPKFMEFLAYPSLHYLRELSGGIVITIGIAGEILFGGWASRRRTILTDRNKLEIAELNRQAEQDRLARREIEERLAYRTLRDTQIPAIADKLREFQGQEFSVSSAWSATEEVQSLVNRLVTTLIMAGWTYANPDPRIPHPAVMSGVVILTHRHAVGVGQTKNAAIALIAALLAENIYVHGEEQFPPIPFHTKILISIGTKP
jgi:hypothetical protein